MGMHLYSLILTSTCLGLVQSYERPNYEVFQSAYGEMNVRGFGLIIPDDNVTSRGLTTTSCECRMRCWAQSKCKVISVHEVDEKLECRSADSPLDKIYLEHHPTGVTEANLAHVKSRLQSDGLFHFTLTPGRNKTNIERACKKRNSNGTMLRLKSKETVEAVAKNEDEEGFLVDAYYIKPYFYWGDHTKIETLQNGGFIKALPSEIDIEGSVLSIEKNKKGVFDLVTSRKYSTVYCLFDPLRQLSPVTGDDVFNTSLGEEINPKN